MAYLVSKNDSDMIDAITVDSEWCLEMFPRGLLYEGNFGKSVRQDVMSYTVTKRHLDMKLEKSMD